MLGSKQKNRKISPKKGLIFIASLLVLLTIIFISAKYASSQSNETKAKSIEIQNFSDNSPTDEGKISQIDAERLEGQDLENGQNEWLSQVIKSDFPFDAIGASWNKDEISKIDILVRFSKDNNKWENWQQFIVDDADKANEKSFSAQSSAFEVSDLAFSKDAQYFQYKIVFYDKKNDSFLESIKFTYIKSKNENNKFSIFEYLGAKKAKAVNSPRIISRAEWGADPSYMTWGPEYVRPNKIIIHHTASGNNPPDPAAVMRSIYYYHAVSLGWGDIGYNYLFDQYGNIYEGRAGGNMVVGAHAYGQNYGSIGFSVIGEFSSVNITPETLNALTDLTSFKAYENDFDITFNTIFGHRDFCNNPPGHNCTACPGDILYGRKGEIIDISRQKESTFLQRDRDFLNNNNNILVKSYSQPTIYYWLDGIKKPIADSKTFAAFDYSINDINYIAGVVLDEKPTGDKISSLVKLTNEPTVYFLVKNPNVKYIVPDPTIFNNYGFDWANIIEVDPSQLENIPLAGSLTLLTKSSDNPTVYKISQGRKYPFVDSSTFADWGYSFGQVTTLKNAFINLYQQDQTIYSLVKGPAANVFLLQSGQKHLIPNAAMFESWNFKWYQITVLNQEEIDIFENGPPLSRIAKGDGPEIYLVDRAKKYLFPDLNTLYKWEGGSLITFQAKNPLLDQLQTAENVNDIIKSNNSPVVYLMFGGKKYPFPDALTFISWGKKWTDIKVFSNELLAEIQNSNLNLSRFIQKESSPQEPEIYLISNGEKRLFTNMAIFYLWGGQEAQIVKLPPTFFGSLNQGPDISAIIKGSGPEIYLLEKGRKDYILDMKTFNAWGFSLDKVTTIQDSELNAIPNGPNLSYLVKNINSPVVYKVENGKKSPIPNENTFLSWGFSFEQISVLEDTTLELLTLDQAITIFAKTSAADTNVYLLNQTDKKHFPNADVLAAWGGTDKITISSYIDSLPTNGEANIIAKGPAAYIYIIFSGQKYFFVDWSTFLAFGYNMNQVTLLNQPPLNELGNAGPFYRLVKGSSSTVYYMENGGKRPIPSVEVFNSYGWSWSLVMVLPDSFVDPFPVGPPLPPYGPSMNVTASGPYNVITAGQIIRTANGGDYYTALYSNGTYYLLDGNSTALWSGTTSIKFTPSNPNVIIEILSYYDPNWNGTTNYNRFRGSVELIQSSSGTWVVNELSLNDYTAGICEAPGWPNMTSQELEYLKAMAVAARSYGLWHLSRGGKHAGEPFILKNSRHGNGNDQVYCGYGFEEAATYYAPQARATDNRVVLYGGNPALTAYSHGSYPRTRSALEAWGIDYPWLQSVADPYGDPNRPCGTGGNHCVGLSASGAIGLARHGTSYIDILGFYYTNISVGSTNNSNIRIAIYSF